MIPYFKLGQRFCISNIIGNWVPYTNTWVWQGFRMCSWKVQFILSWWSKAITYAIWYICKQILNIRRRLVCCTFINQACLYLTNSLNKSQFNFINISLLGDNGSASKISRAAFFCNFVMTFSFSLHPVPQTIQQYSMIGLNCVGCV